MLFVLNGDNDDRDENGEEEEACYGAETRRAALHRTAPLAACSEASPPPTNEH